MPTVQFEGADLALILNDSIIFFTRWDGTVETLIIIIKSQIM